MQKRSHETTSAQRGGTFIVLSSRERGRGRVIWLQKGGERAGGGPSLRDATHNGKKKFLNEKTRGEKCDELILISGKKLQRNKWGHLARKRKQTLLVITPRKH